MPKVIALCSGGGGTIKAIYNSFKNLQGEGGELEGLEVIADRECGALEWAERTSGVRATRIQWEEDQTFLKKHLEENAPCIAITFIHKILSKEILDANNVKFMNTHYSLLPSFKGHIGMNSLQQALEAGCGIVGATSHKVTQVLDGGPILSQVAFSINRGEGIDKLSEIMFQCGCLCTLLALRSEMQNQRNLDKAIENNILRIGRNVLAFPATSRR
jgi:phosphoribosylglycinamide formyltransferase-1